MDDSILLREHRGAVTRLVLNRPEQYNAISDEMLFALQSALDEIGADSQARVVVIAGRGRAFSAGHDLKQMRAHPDEAYYRDLFGRCARVMRTLTTIPQTVIAQVHGIATAAGCQLVAASDLAVASDQARFATSGINVGLFCSSPGVPLSRNVARKRAFEMLITGEFISAEKALEFGLVNRVVSPEELDAAVVELADQIVAKSPVATRVGKEMFYRQLELDAAGAYEYAAEVMARNMMAEDAGIGIDAFIAKKEPRWKGR